MSASVGRQGVQRSCCGGDAGLGEKAWGQQLHNTSGSSSTSTTTTPMRVGSQITCHLTIP
jgi:hypothetical protein